MSASQDKKRRQAEREAGTSPKTMAEREALRKQRKERRTWTIVGIIVALFVIVVVVLNTNLFYTGTTAMTIGDYKFTNAEYQYYYNTAYNNFVYANQNYISFIGLDTSEPLDEQPFGDTQSSLITAMGSTLPDSMTDANRAEDATWADYFRAVALDNMVQVTALWDAAVKAGYTLSEEDSEAIDTTISNYESYAEMQDLRGADGYIALVYGKGVNSNTVRELLSRAYIAQAYSKDIFDGFEYTTDEINSYYDEHADVFDAFNVDYYLVAAEKEEVTETVTDDETGEETEQTNEEVTDATMADAKTVADSIAAAVESGTDFSEAVANAVADAEPAELTNVSGYNIKNNFSSEFSDWILSGDRAEGDVGIIESDGVGYYVLVFHSRNDNSSYNAVNFRHILIKAEDSDEDGTISDEEKSAAEEKLNTVYDTWKEGDATEDSFASLANQYSEDSGSNGSSATSSTGGLYEHVAVDQMVPEINEWIFDPARQPGDTTMVYVEAANYTGWHLVYFVGTDEMTYHDCLAELGIGNTTSTNAVSGLRQDDYDAWEADTLSGWTVSVNSFINWFAKV